MQVKTISNLRIVFIEEGVCTDLVDFSDILPTLADMSGAPFEEKVVVNRNYPGAAEARKELNKVLEELDPKSGKTYDQWKGSTYKGVPRVPGHKRPDFK